MLMTYSKSQFEMPDGKYVAKFTGVTMREDKPGEKPRLGNDGKPLPPAMTWDFVIVGGEHAGKKADKLTGRTPTPKSGCGKMLAAIADTVLKDGQQIDLSQFVGCLYRITVEDNRVSDSPAPVRMYDSQSPAQQQAGGFPSSTSAPQHASNPEAKWDINDGTSIERGITSVALQELINSNPKAFATLQVKPHGSPPGTAVGTPKEYGFTDVIPF